jgi:hypothetical protein
MPDPDFHIDKTDNAIIVRLDVSTRSPRTRFWALLFFVAITVFGMCALLFSPGKHGRPSMWHDISSAPPGSDDLIVGPVILLVFPVFMFLVSRRYVIMAYPSDERLDCDRSSITMSRVRWLDIHNSHWETKTYPLSDLTDLRYVKVASSRGVTIYGLRFRAAGRNERILPGLNTQQAGVILGAMERFGIRRGTDHVRPNGT